MAETGGSKQVAKRTTPTCCFWLRSSSLVVVISPSILSFRLSLYHICCLVAWVILYSSLSISLFSFFHLSFSLSLSHRFRFSELVRRSAEIIIIITFGHVCYSTRMSFFAFVLLMAYGSLYYLCYSPWLLYVYDVGHSFYSNLTL